MRKISKILFSIIVIVVIINMASCNQSESNKKLANVENEATNINNGETDNVDNETMSDTLDNDLNDLNIKFDNHGPKDENSIRFNPNTGDVLYIASNIYPPYRHEKNDLNDYDFLGGKTLGSNKIEHEYDETEKFLYLRNIYTQEMFLVDKIKSSNEENYSYNFTKDGQVEINGNIVTKGIKTQKNLVYAECNAFKSNFIKENPDLINSALKINEEVANKVSEYIKDNYDIDSEALLTLDYNGVSYVVINIPEFYININNEYAWIDTSYKYHWQELPYNETGSSVELWKYENEECKRLLYSQINLSIYNIVDSKGYVIILGYEAYPGYIIRVDKNNNMLYGSKLQGLSNSPDGRYTLMYNLDESFTVVENDKIIIDYKFRDNDDINTFWYKTIIEMGPYWWDTEFNKLYILEDPSINSTSFIYCVDLKNKKVEHYGSFKYDHLWKNINKEFSYIYSDDSKISLEYNPEMYCANLFTYKKFNNYLYNLVTNEKFYIANKAIYSSNINDIKINNNLITYKQSSKYIPGDGEVDLEAIELTIDISQYIGKNRINYLNSIKKSITESYNNSIAIDDIKLCLIFNSNNGNYQIVKINEADINSYYELWKIESNSYKKILSRTDSIFLTNNQEYLFAVSKNGELKVYDKNFNCIMDENIYSENLLSRYDVAELEIADYYVMKFDKNIFITIKSGENFVDVVNVNVVDKKISSIDYDLNCHYDNYFINPENGYLVYQDGPSIVKYDNFFNRYEANIVDIKDTLTAVNLITGDKKTIFRDELGTYIYH